LQMVGAEIEGSLFLRNGFISDGEVGLVGVRVRGSLDCEAGTFRGGILVPDEDRYEGVVLNASGAKIGTSAYLRGGFTAVGEVRLLGADIGRDLVLINASLPGSMLNAQAATIGGILICQQVRGGNAEINLMGVSAGVLVDDQEGWPQPGKLHL